jgi:predicted nucleic acid-binding protein
MITAVLGTNVIVQSLFAHSRGAARGVLDSYFEGRFRPQFSDETLDELLAVLILPGIRAEHRLSDDALLEFIASLLANADRYSAGPSVPPALPRDITNTKFLALASHAKGQFLVTNDRRHLLRLKKFATTRIVTPAAFLRSIRSSN